MNNIMQNTIPSQMRTTDEYGIEQNTIDNGGRRGGGSFESGINFIKEKFNIETPRDVKQRFETKKLEEQAIKEQKQKEIVAENEQKQDAEQKENWAREDAIRKETQEREDTQYQRLIADMRKAGINPNLIMGTPASGGGISNATQKDLSRSENEKDRLLEKLMLELSQAFEGDQNSKDRALKIFSEIMGYVKTSQTNASNIAGKLLR